MTLLCAGEAFEDLIFVGLDRLPGPGEEVKTDTFVATVGGGAVITAVAAARLGMTVDLLSALGPAGVKQLRAEQVRITNLIRPGEAHAITAALSTTGERAFVTYNGVNTKLEGRLAKAIPVVTANHIHLCFYPHNTALWTTIVTRLRKKGITTSWDFGWNEPLSGERGLIDLIDALDFVFVNELEARLYTGEATLTGALPHWRQRQAIVIVKQGESGAMWLAPDREIHFPAPRVKVVDTTGAGDAFNAGFLVAWMRGKSPVECLAAGNKVGAASTQHAGGI
jgi:sugar/nucleoside kinase (ribokinase family)